MPTIHFHIMALPLIIKILILLSIVFVFQEDNLIPHFSSTPSAETSSNLYFYTIFFILSSLSTWVFSFMIIFINLFLFFMFYTDEMSFTL